MGFETIITVKFVILNLLTIVNSFSTRSVQNRTIELDLEYLYYNML